MRKRENVNLLLFYQCIGIFFLFLVSLIFNMNVFAADLKKEKEDVGEYSHRLLDNRDESRAICGDFRVTAFSDYRSDGKFRDIMRQYFEFTDLTNGKKTMVVASNMPMIEGYNEKFWSLSKERLREVFLKEHPLDGSAYDWICLKGKNEHYLVIGYGTGGNCDNCEWIEIMNKKGEILDRSVINRRQTNREHFEETLKKLGLPALQGEIFTSITYQSGLIKR